MKRYLFFIQTLVCLLGFVLSSCTRTLDPQEIATLKEGKTFWTWKSSYGDFDTYYLERGKGDRHVVLLHGFGAHTFTWRFIIDSLADKGYHVWALDLLGYGLSDKPTDVPYGVDLFIHQIEAFTQAKGIKKAHFIGNSMGGALALGMAVVFPQQVRSLVLIDALGYPMDPPWLLAAGRLMGSFAQPFMGELTVKQMLKEVTYNEKTITDEQIQAYTMPFNLPGGTQAFIATLKAYDKTQLDALSKKYSQIDVPVLIIWGEKDKWIPLPYYKHFLEDFPHAQTLLIPNCGHIPQEECPKQVESAILRFFSQLYFLD